MEIGAALKGNNFFLIKLKFNNRWNTCKTSAAKGIITKKKAENHVRLIAYLIVWGQKIEINKSMIIIMLNLTEDDLASLEKIDKERRQHAEAPKNFRKRKTYNDREYKEK